MGLCIPIGCELGEGKRGGMSFEDGHAGRHALQEAFRQIQYRKRRSEGEGECSLLDPARSSLAAAKDIKDPQGARGGEELISALQKHLWEAHVRAPKRCA